jgi:predicted NodU family carbamoyl transferase
MPTVLGLNCCLSPPENDFMPRRFALYFHDAAAVLVRDGEVLAAVEQERLNRVKHTTAFAGDAMRACLDIAGLSLRQVDRLAFFFDEAYIDSELYQEYAADPSLPLAFSRQLLADRIREYVQDGLAQEAFTFVQHHTAHAFSAFPQSGYTDALVVVMDGSGEYESMSVYDGRRGRMELLDTKDVDRSLGLFYLAGTQLLGYRLFDEYKVMGLAPHGDPATFRPVFQSLYELADGGRFRLNYTEMQPAFVGTGLRPRRRGEPFSQAHKDFAAGLQEAMEDIGYHVVQHWQRETGHTRLAIAGGVGQNCTFNGRLVRSGMFDDVFVHPAAHDAGAALGAALKVHEDLGGALPARRVRQVFWGRALPPRGEIERLLDRWGRFVTYRRSTAVEREAAALLAEDRVLGWVQGRSEFGPRALGNRSILADPRPEANRDRVNLMVKRRETYRPFAPSVQAENLRDYFDFPDGMDPSDFMVFTVPVRPERRHQLGAVTHVDGTARVHAVDRSVNPRFWLLLEEFEVLTGLPVVLNTSFNNQAEPIVDSVLDALRCFLTTRIDHLIVDELIINKTQWTHEDVASLAPQLTPTARLHTIAAPGRSPRHMVRFNHLDADEWDLAPELFRVLARADGHTPLAALADPHPEVLAQLLELWNQRYVDLVPPS